MEIRAVEKTFKEISNTSLKMRKDEKDFLMRETKSEAFMSSGKSKYVTSMGFLVNKQDSLIDNLLQSKWSAKLEIEDELANLKTSIGDYHATFGKIVNAYKQRGFKDFGDEGELRKAIKAVEESEYKIDMVQLLSLRRTEKDFFLRRDLADADKFRAEIKDFKTQMDNGSRGLAIKEKLSAYEEKFNAIVEAEVSIGLNENSGLTGEMRTNIYKIEPVIEKLEQVVEVSSQEMVSQTTLTFAIVFLVELLIGIALAIQFSNSLTSNIQYVREAAVKLS